MGMRICFRPQCPWQSWQNPVSRFEAGDQKSRSPAASNFSLWAIDVEQNTACVTTCNLHYVFATSCFAKHPRVQALLEAIFQMLGNATGSIGRSNQGSHHHACCHFCTRCSLPIFRYLCRLVMWANVFLDVFISSPLKLQQLHQWTAEKGISKTVILIVGLYYRICFLGWKVSFATLIR